MPHCQQQGPDIQVPAVSSSDSLPPTLVSPIAKTIQSEISQRQHPRIFLDLCAGYERPLSQALRQLGMDVLSIDKLLSLEHDLLNVDFCESILRLCASGVVGYTACSPSCNLYSRLRLRPNGPPALRTPEHLSGIPGLSPTDLEKVQLSAALLHICIDCLLVNYAAGSHGHLEQPSTAMSWSETAVQHWILQAACTCINLPACKFGLDLHKQWMFATSFSDLRSLGGVCNHPQGSHQNIAGVKSPEGVFISRETAKYPAALATAFASLIAPLLSAQHGDLTVQQASAMVPVKEFGVPPNPRHDGGGFPSCADWSSPAPHQEDVFKSLRAETFDYMLQSGRYKKLLTAFAQRQDDPPFSQSEVDDFRRMLSRFLTSNGYTPDWTIPDDQPMNLFIMQQLSQISCDDDRELFHHLIAGVPTGIHSDIPPSGCFPLQRDPIDNSEIQLSVHHSNWRSADDNIELTRELAQKEIDEGWVEVFDGSLGDAQLRWPAGVSVGKLGIATSERRPPRLVVDSSICGLNSKCTIPERGTLPSIKDVCRCYPLRENRHHLSCLSLDVKSAHKRIVVKPTERGLLGFNLDGKLHFYKVAPFGAVFSASWWGRLSGFLMRTFHRLIWIKHCGWIYVDDFLLMQDAQILPLTACFLVIFCQALNIPLSWKKCELASEVKWIGWTINAKIGVIRLPEEKRERLLTLIQQLIANPRTTRKHVEQFIGLAMWATSLFPHMRVWLHALYTDLHSVPATLFSIDPGQWDEVVSCLSDSLVFQRTPTGTSIPLNGILVSIRHQQVRTLTEVRRCLLSERRIWIRVRDLSSKKRKLSDASQHSLHLFRSWTQSLPPIVSMWPKPTFSGTVAADACASGSSCQIGGYIQTDSQQWWFSEKYSHSDFAARSVTLDPNMQRSIGCFETLAQIALLWIAVHHISIGRFPLRLPSVSDNTSAEAGVNKMFTTVAHEIFSGKTVSPGFDIMH